MKHLAIITSLIFLTILALGSCKEKQRSDDIITTKYVPKRPVEPIPMEPIQLNETVTWMGNEYNITILRHPADSLPMASNEIGQKYIDNRIRLTIRRPDGSALFDRTFTKASFTAYLPDELRRNSLLTDMRFKDTDGSKLEFVASIAEPEATEDEYLPLKLTVDRSGAIDITVEDDLDMLDHEEALGDE